MKRAKQLGLITGKKDYLERMKTKYKNRNVLQEQKQLVDSMKHVLCIIVVRSPSYF